jgi:hypothetical protein
MTTKDIEIGRLADDQLRTFYRNALRRGALELAATIARELYRRGKIKPAELRTLRWNESAIAELLQPFVEVAGTILRNRRTTYTAGGGLRRKPKSDPARMMVDSYSAMKRGKINAAFAGRVKEPGEEPMFELLLNGQKRVYQLPELDQALAEWQRIAEAA